MNRGIARCCSPFRVHRLNNSFFAIRGSAKSFRDGPRDDVFAAKVRSLCLTPPAMENIDATGDGKIDVFGLSTVEFGAALKSNLGVPTFRAKQIRDFVFRKGATSFATIPNLPNDLKNILPHKFSLYENATVLSEVFPCSFSRAFALSLSPFLPPSSSPPPPFPLSLSLPPLTSLFLLHVCPSLLSKPCNRLLPLLPHTPTLTRRGPLTGHGNG